MPTQIKNKSPLEKDGKVGSMIGGVLGGIGGFLVGGPGGAKLGYMAGSKIGEVSGKAIDKRQKERGTGPYAEGGRFEDEGPQPEYTTNIDPMTGEEMDMPGVTGLAMTGEPSMIKMLTPVKASYSNLKMSAKEAKQGGLMMKISGAESLTDPAALKMSSKEFEMLDGKQGKSGADFAEYKRQQYKNN